MKYYIDLFSPETHQAYSVSDRTITGFRPRHKRMAERISIGDVLICYVTRVSRWVGLLEVKSEVFEDYAPVFAAKDDPFPVRFRVAPLVWLSVDKSVPIHTDECWEHLSFTRGLPKNSTAWTGKVRGSLAEISKPDGELLRRLLARQDSAEEMPFPLSADEHRKLRPPTVRVLGDQEIAVSIPTEEEPEAAEPTGRESSRIQALVAQIGEKMGFRIWIPRSDRTRVEAYWHAENDVLLDELPLNYDEATLNTVEQIDVLWLRRRTIVRAFEIEHTTAIHSGILRMADLLALQPNLEIKAHIVAPSERREKVYQEITRPVFALLERGPLTQACTYLPYEAIEELSNERHLEHMSDSVLDEYAEEADS